MKILGRNAIISTNQKTIGSNCPVPLVGDAHGPRYLKVVQDFRQKIGHVSVQGA